MVDLKRVQEKIENYSASQKQIAEDKCNEAKLILQKASREKQNKEQIDIACELLVQAIQTYPKFTEPYRILSYIMAMFEQYETAVKLLNQSLKIEPGNPYAQSMLEEYREKAINKDFSEKIHKISSQSLTEKIKSRGFSPLSVFEKINLRIERFIINTQQSEEKTEEVPLEPKIVIPQTLPKEEVKKVISETKKGNNNDFMANLQQIRERMGVKIKAGNNFINAVKEIK